MHHSGAADVLRTYRRAAGCDGKHHVSAFSNLLQQFVQVFQSCLGRSVSQLLNSMVLTSILVLVTNVVVVLTSIFVVSKSIRLTLARIFVVSTSMSAPTTPLPPAVWSVETTKIKCQRDLPRQRFTSQFGRALGSKIRRAARSTWRVRPTSFLPFGTCL